MNESRMENYKLPTEDELLGMDNEELLDMYKKTMDFLAYLNASIIEEGKKDE